MRRWFSSARWGLILLGAAAPVTLLIATLMKVSQRYSIPLIMIELLIFGSQLMWQHAKENATGEEWWQKDSSE
jgi:hypothetical protein